ncbi:MAG: hypothetical protein AAFX50_05580 [Acidobacteriota bacterium]
MSEKTPPHPSKDVGATAAAPDATKNGCPEYLNLSRRRFLGIGAGALASAAVPAWVPRVAYADSQTSRDVVVSIFLRGGADALTLCVPFMEDNYYRLRPTQAVPRPDSSAPNRALDLDGRFGFAPAMAPLLEAYGAGHLALVHACGQPTANRSHFDAMHFVESGHGDPPGSLTTGWLGRHLQQSAPTRADGVLRALSLGFGLPETLAGAPESLPISDPVNLDFQGRAETADARRETLEALYADLDRPSARRPATPSAPSRSCVSSILPTTNRRGAAPTRRTPSARRCAPPRR